MNKTRHRGPRRSDFTIVDRNLLGSMIRGIVDTRFEGNLSAAVRATNLAVNRALRAGPPRGDRCLLRTLRQPQLHKLASGRIGAVRPATFVWLHLLIGDDVKMWQVFMPADARERLALHRGTLAVSPSRHAWHVWNGVRDDIIHRMRSRHESAFSAFDTSVERLGHTDEAIEAAYARLAEPFVRAALSGGIDRVWDELSELEQAAYLKAALARELILLNREPDLQRAQRPSKEHWITKLGDALAANARRRRARS